MKKLSIGVIILTSILFSGCGSDPEVSKYSVSEATDYAMSCQTILNEIKAVRGKVNNEENLIEAMIPSYLKNTEELTSRDKIVLYERVKSLQLLYAVKQAKGECRELNSGDMQGERKSMLKKTIDDVNEVLK